MMHQARQRIVQFLQLAHCHFRVEGQQIITANARLHFSEQDISISRQGKPVRSMPYAKLNLDRLFALITAQTTRRPAL
jgi:head-tail adaptor